MLEKLKEYKELITIIVFFLGGVFWLQSEYPTKSDLKNDLNNIDCKLDNYMKLTQLEIDSQEHDKKLVELSKRLSDAPEDNVSSQGLPVSPAMRAELDQLKVDQMEQRTELKKTTKDMEDILRDLERGVCKK